MKSKLQYLITIAIVIIVSVVMYGCKHTGIEFRHDSAVKKMMDNIKLDDKPVLKKSSGVIIYKDNSTTNSTSKSPRFGPKDLDFDIKIK